MKFPIWDWKLRKMLKKMEEQNYTYTQMGMRTYISNHRLFPTHTPGEIRVRVKKFFLDNNITEEM